MHLFTQSDFPSPHLSASVHTSIILSPESHPVHVRSGPGTRAKAQFPSTVAEWQEGQLSTSPGPLDEGQVMQDTAR